MKKSRLASTSLLNILLFAAMPTAEAFTIPKDIPMDDFILQNIASPTNGDPLFYSDLLKKSLITLHSYQASVESCIKTTGSSEDCDLGKHGIPKQASSMNNQLGSTAITVKNGVITLYPIVNKDLPVNLSSSLIATPQDNNGSISWDYSGNIFDYDKIKHFKRNSTDALSCPDPTTFPPNFKNYRYFVDLQGIKYQIKGNKALLSKDSPISFLWAAYPAVKETSKIACVYKIGDAPLQNNWFSLTTLDDVAEVPQEGLWNSVQIGVCPTTNSLAAAPVKMGDCPFKLKVTAGK